jgi:anaerobic dimethyl sulfoxide reductase subunit C (anchor subunit)
MNNDSWSLVFFTLLSQACAGLMVLFASLYFIDGQAFQAMPNGFNLMAPEFIALLMIAVAVVFSFLHLGKPLHAVNAMNHIASSWLSREIFAVLLFGASVIMVFIARIYSPFENWLMPASLLFSASTGIFLVAMISKVYLIRTIPPWNSWHTPTSFFLTVLILGGTGTILLILNNTNISENGFVAPKIIFGFSWAVAIFLAIEIITTMIFQSRLTKMSPAGIGRISFTSEIYHTLYLIRTFIVFIALLFTIYFIVRLPGISDNFQAHLRFFAMIFSLIVVEEIIGRYQFYASYYRVGV